MPSSRGSSQPRIEPKSIISPALAGRFFTSSTTWEALGNTLPHVLKITVNYIFEPFRNVCMKAQKDNLTFNMQDEMFPALSGGLQALPSYMSL